MKKTNTGFFIKLLPITMAVFALSTFNVRADDIENKARQFDDILSESSENKSQSSKNELAEQIRRQREAIEARENAAVAESKTKGALVSGQNACDMGLRKCMQDKCGSDFTKCALDGDTILGDKMNSCRRDITCTGEEFKLFTNEIKEDLAMNVKLSSYTKVIDCGNQYNNCIQTECGATFNKCLGKSAGDRAVDKCSTIAKNCAEQDSGMVARIGTVFGKLRENAEKEVKADEERMYKLRDLMRAQCTRLGAAFDERSFDCVYTVNFFAGDDQRIPKATRKRYAGDTFVCMQEWFGINVTTYKENAYRETRAQSAASSAMLGSGLGTAAGLISSGAIDRALKTQKAKKDYKKECKSQGGKLKDGECVQKGDKGYDKIKPEDEDKDNSKAEAKAECKENGGTWILGKCKGKKNNSDESSDEDEATATEESADSSDDASEDEPLSEEELERRREYEEELADDDLESAQDEAQRMADENEHPTTLKAPIDKPAAVKAEDVKINVKIPDKKLTTKDKMKINNAKTRQKVQANNAKIKEGAKEFGAKLKDAFTIKKK